jgi:hypothetical protein
MKNIGYLVNNFEDRIYFFTRFFLIYSYNISNSRLNSEYIGIAVNDIPSLNKIS